MPVLHNYLAKEYNGGGQVWASLQDSRGLMYFGVSSGTVLEFDGVTWRKILVPASVVRSLAGDDSGKIWVGANASFGFLAPDSSGTLNFVSLLEKIPAEHRGFTDVWQTLPTKQGIFFRSYERLFRWDGQQMQVWVPQPGTRFQALSEVRGHIYTAQEGIGLQEIVGNELRAVPGGDAYKNSIKLFLHPYDEGRILVSARDGGLSLYDGQKVVPFKTDADAYLKQHRMYISTLLSDGRICVTTLSGGVVILRHDGALQETIDEGSGLLGSDILSAYQDREGGLWLGSDPGVARVEVNSPVSIFSRTGTLDVIRYKGSIYASGVSGRSGVTRLVSDPQTRRPSMQSLAGPSQGWTFAEFKDPANPVSEQLLIATSEGVMKVLGDSLVPAMPAVHGLQEQTYVIGLSKKNPSRVLIGHSDGVGSMRWDGRSWIDEGRLPNLIYEARNVAEDREGNVWVSGGNGKVLRVQMAPTGMRDSKVEIVSHDQGLIGEGGTDIEAVGGEIFATVEHSSNMFRWDSAANKFVVDNRLLLPVDAPDATSFLNPIGENQAWALTVSSDRRRLGLFRRQSDGSWKLEEDRYRQLNRLRLFAFHLDTDGSTWITGEGLFRYAPFGQGNNPQPFLTTVREVKAGASTVFGGTTMPGASTVRLAPGSNALRFKFSALTYANPVETMYQYLLEGADGDWSPWEKQNEANFSGLGPGSYRFRVRARADDGRTGDEGDFAFTILPPWYRTTLAYIAYAVLLLLLCYLGWRLISRYERRKARRKTQALEVQAKQLEATVNERTQEIRAQATEIAAQRD